MDRNLRVFFAAWRVGDRVAKGKLETAVKPVKLCVLFGSAHFARDQ